MQFRKHLFSLRLAHALRESVVDNSYNRQRFMGDAVAGLTVGIIAIPLSMALAIASGVAPQYGLYTAIVAGVLIALTGGSRFSVSGPTAAFVVILFPVADKFGLGGLLTATFLSGIILLIMAFARLGRLIEYIPDSVTLGFTAGIAIVIATLQLKDFFGLSMAYPESYIGKVQQVMLAMPGLDWPDFVVGFFTLVFMIIWSRFSQFPAHVPALFAGTLLALLMQQQGFAIDTIGDRFTYLMPDGSEGHGIPPFLPEFTWPWQQMGADGQPLGLSWELLTLLLPAAFSIAMLGAIESLLCAVVLDNMTQTRHSANSELLGQGIGNVVAPFFGGITATAAIARSAANLRAGASSPVAAIIHGLVVLIGLLLLAKMLSYLPMSAMAALLLMVAWNIADRKNVLHFLKTAPKSDVIVMLSCLSLTVLFDMVIAIAVGVVLAALLFMRDISELTKVSNVSEHEKWVKQPLAEGWQVFKISGALFFAAADRVFAELSALSQNNKGIVIYMGEVTVLDAGGLSALMRFLQHCEKQQIQVRIADLQFQPLKTLAKAKVQAKPDRLLFYPNLDEALVGLTSTEPV